ncbi:MAG: orotidine-5'-phosphate decarboxylase [Synergistaceae bacterium]|nr:orotidine-5'-phosphate decarboxylase [Synergistaceae bacterium]
MEELQIDRLIHAIEEKQNPSILGLDTRIEYVPESFARQHGGDAAAIVRAFNFALLDVLREIIPCVKIQVAYYERMGLSGGACLFDTLMEARRMGYVVILDAKRGDIGPTAAAYSGAYLAPDAPLPADFMTVNPYLGVDGVRPFIEDCERTGRGIFVLVKTSNPSSGEFQDLLTEGGDPLFVRVGDKVSKWGESLMGREGYSSVGAVVGATYPEQGSMLRRRMPHTFFLLPGYGAQGAAASSLSGCFDSRGRGAAVNASRSLLCAHKKAGTEDFVSAARDEAVKMRSELQKALHTRS